MQKKPGIVIVIPARNEQDTIQTVLKRVHAVNGKHKLGAMQVLVVSDSTDNTNDLARKAGAIVVRGDGTGLGSAMFRGIKEAAKLGPDIIVSMDGDGQTEPEEIPEIIKPILRNEADLVIGSRFLDKKSVEYKMPLINRIGNASLSWIVRRITKLPITDAQAGFRAMRREVAESLEMIGTHTYVQETIIDAAKKSFRVKEIPSRWGKRLYGRSKVVSSAKRYFIWTLPILIFRAGLHMMLFTVLGLLFMLAGILLGILLLVAENFDVTRMVSRTPMLILITLLVTVGMQMFFFGFLLGLVADVKNRLYRKL